MHSSNRSRYYRLAKEGVWIIVGQIASVFGTLVLVRVLTEHLDPTQYGHLALGLTVTGLVNQAVMGGITAGIGRFYSIAAEKQDLQRYLWASSQLMVYATAVVVAIGFVLITGLLWLGYSQWMGLAAAALVFSILSGYNSSLNGIQTAARQRPVVALHGGLDAWLKIVLAVGVMLWLGSSSTAVVIGYTLSSLLVTGSQFIFLRRLIPLQGIQTAEPTPWARQMWTYSWPFSTWGIFTWIQQSSDRWALEAFSNTHEVGLYAVLFQLGYTPIALATGMVMTFVAPIFYQRAGDATDPSRNANVHRLALRIALFSLLITLIGFGVALGLNEWIFRLLVAVEFRAVSYLLPWMVLAGGLFATGLMMALQLMSDMKTAAMSRVKIITALLGVIFSIYGASIAGLCGVVGALVAFSVLYLAWMALISFRIPFVVEISSKPQ